jgi:hypothetical protein
MFIFHLLLAEVKKETLATENIFGILSLHLREIFYALFIHFIQHPHFTTMNDDGAESSILFVFPAWKDAIKFFEM